jgi:hypothetical protein
MVARKDMVIQSQLTMAQVGVQVEIMEVVEISNRATINLPRETIMTTIKMTCRIK